MDHGQMIPKATAINRAAVNIEGLYTSFPHGPQRFRTIPHDKIQRNI